MQPKGKMSELEVSSQQYAFKPEYIQAKGNLKSEPRTVTDDYSKRTSFVNVDAQQAYNPQVIQNRGSLKTEPRTVTDDYSKKTSFINVDAQQAYNPQVIQNRGSLKTEPRMITDDYPKKTTSINVHTQQATKPENIRQRKRSSYRSQPVTNTYTPTKEPVTPKKSQAKPKKTTAVITPNYAQQILTEILTIKQQLPKIVEQTKSEILIDMKSRIPDVKSQIQQSVDPIVENLQKKMKTGMIIAGVFAGITLILQCVSLYYMIKKGR